MSTYTYPHTIENGAGEQLTFVRRVKDPAGDRLEVDNLVKPGSGPPMHVHHYQVEACRRIFASDTRWTVVRGSDLEEGDSQGLPVWSRHVGDPILESNITRRVDFALFMVEASRTTISFTRPPPIVSRQSPSALAHAAA